VNRRDRWVLAAGAAFLVLVVPVAYGISRPDRDDVYAAVTNAADELRSTPVEGLSVTGSDVGDALSAGNPPSRGGKFRNSITSELEIRSAGADGQGDRYEITTDSGKHPVCLVVSLDRGLPGAEPAFPSVSVIDGPC
jgi:hypothetical protein